MSKQRTKMAQSKVRLDHLLLSSGLFDDLFTAHGWILGAKVLVDNVVNTFPGSLVSPSAQIHLRGQRLRYASRGGYKLEHALKRFEISVAGKVVLDAGACTGGFTDCALQAGARHVYAVEVGYGQLRGHLAINPRVTSLERTNLSDLVLSQLSEGLDLAVADLSYLSLSKALPVITALFHGDVDIVALIKPLYEGLRQEDLTNVRQLGNVLASLLAALEKVGVYVRSICASPILGSRSSIEFLARFGSTRGLVSLEAAQHAIHDFELNPPRAAPDR